LVSSGVIVSAILAQKLMHFPGGLLGAFDEVYLHELVAWYSAALCFYFFYRFCNSASPLFTFFPMNPTASTCSTIYWQSLWGYWLSKRA